MNETVSELTETEPRRKIPFPLAFTLIIAAILAVGFLLTFSATFAVAAIFCGIVGLVGNYKDSFPDRRKDAPAVRIISMLLFVGFLFLFPPPSITSAVQWQYPFQKAYLGLYQNSSEPEWFPDFIGDIESDYYFDYMPSILQGTGHYSVEFVTTPECARRYADAFAETAQYRIPLRDYGYNYTIGGKPLSLYTGTGFRNDENAEIYVISTNFNENHPHSSAVIIDTATGKVQFSQYG